MISAFHGSYNIKFAGSSRGKYNEPNKYVEKQAISYAYTWTKKDLEEELLRARTVGYFDPQYCCYFRKGFTNKKWVEYRFLTEGFEAEVNVFINHLLDRFNLGLNGLLLAIHTPQLQL